MGGFDELLAGYVRFRRDGYPRNRETYRALAAEGQAPKVMVIGCCDSRVDPQTIFDAGPGELFVVRNVANLVPPYATDGGHHGTSAAIEFAVDALNVAHIVVLGHAACGGIRALMDGAGRTGDSHIGRWMSIAQPALEKLQESRRPVESADFAGDLEKAVIGNSLQNLRGFPAVGAAVSSRGLRLHGAWFDIENGDLHLLDDAEAAFTPVAMPATNNSLDPDTK